MGIVFKAEHRLMERIVALKTIHKSLTQRHEAVERFRQEAKAAARLSHPNIVAAFDAEQAGELHFLVMEYIEGTNLDQRVRSEGPLPVALACEIIRQAALGLQHAHERGMVHRDLKPHNLLWTPTGQVKILDFGLARFCSEYNDNSLTAPGVVLGTPDFIAPEQALDARQADIRADIYSLGCTLYFLLAGRPPFPEGSALQKLMAHQQRMPRPLTALRPDVPAELLRILDRLTAKHPGERYQTPADVAERLAPFAADNVPPLAAASSVLQRGAADSPTIPFNQGKSAENAARRRRALALIAGGALLSAVLFCTFFLSRNREAKEKGQNEEQPVSMAAEPLAEGEIRRLRSPARPCFRAVFAPDCRRALVAGLDFNISICGLEKENDRGSADIEFGELVGHKARPMSFAFSGNGRRALSGGMDATVRLWDLDQKRLLRTFDKHASWVRGVDFVGETSLAISGDNNGRVLLWNTRDGQLIHEFRGHEAVVYSMMASHSGRLAVSTSDDRTVRVWNLSLLSEAHCLRGHEDKTICAVLSGDDRFVVSGSADQTVRVWDLATARSQRILRGHPASINAVAISADNRQVLSADHSGVIRLWDLATGKDLSTYQFPVKQIIRAIAFCPDGRSFVSAGDDGIIRFWRLP
jgi:WD40 repeat protein